MTQHPKRRATDAPARTSTPAPLPTHIRLYSWLVAVSEPEAPEVRESRLQTMPDSALLFAMCVGWSLGGPIFVLVIEPATWAVVWLIACALLQSARFQLTFMAKQSNPDTPNLALTYVSALSLLALAPGIVRLAAADDERFVALSIVLTLGWMSYVASHHASFPRLGTAMLTAFGLSLAGGLLFFSSLWTIGAFAITFPTAYYVMMLQNHQIVVAALSAQHENRRLSLHDPLTGLPNRLMLNEWLAQRSIEQADQAPGAHRFAVFCLDLNGFKAINDNYGHASGDEVLANTAKRLLTDLRGDDIVCRIGGDEFVVLMDNVPATEASAIAKRLVATCSTPAVLSIGVPVSISASVGVALYPEHADKPSSVLLLADAALYVSKESAEAAWTLHSDPSESYDAARDTRLSGTQG